MTIVPSPPGPCIRVRITRRYLQRDRQRAAAYHRAPSARAFEKNKYPPPPTGIIYEAAGPRRFPGGYRNLRSRAPSYKIIFGISELYSPLSSGSRSQIRFSFISPVRLVITRAPRALIHAGRGIGIRTLSRSIRLYREKRHRSRGVKARAWKPLRGPSTFHDKRRNKNYANDRALVEVYIYEKQLGTETFPNSKTHLTIRTTKIRGQTCEEPSCSRYLRLSGPGDPVIWPFAGRWTDKRAAYVAFSASCSDKLRRRGAIGPFEEQERRERNLRGRIRVDSKRGNVVN